MWKRFAAYGLLSLLVLITGAFCYLYFRPPASRPAPQANVNVTPERIARGKYIWTVASCDVCHSQHDPETFALIASGVGAGTEIPEPELPGRVVAPNITPDPETGIGRWTDGEKMRAIREGVSRDGRALFPMMPYTDYRHMSDEDVYSLIAFMKTLKPVRNALPRTELDFPVSMFIKGVPRPLTEPVGGPGLRDSRARGEYLVTIGRCIVCHTPAERGQIDVTRRLSGGRRFQMGKWVQYSANITPDPATGIGNWTADYFKERVYRYKDAPPPRWTLMPWQNLAQLPPGDLEAIFQYLRLQRPIENRVKTESAKVAFVRP